MQLSALYRYPLKSAMAEIINAAIAEPRGLEADRRWLLCDPEGVFITGRQLGVLVRWEARAHTAGLMLRHPSGERLDVEVPSSTAPRVQVRVWSDWIAAVRAGADVNAVLSRWLSRDVVLYYMDDEARRPVDPRFSAADEEVSFADGFPYLIIGQSSLDGLNERLRHPVSMLRFRPNLVITGAPPHAEDAWQSIRIGSIHFDLPKPCTRCVFTTVRPEDGERDPDGEPLNTLKTYRRTGQGVVFGMNAIARERGVIRVGDPVVVLRP